MRTLSSHEIVVEMLERYMDLCGAGEMGATSGSYRDSRPLEYHPLWKQGTFFELARCLLLMRDQEPHFYWHTAERYLRVKTRITMGCPGCGKATREGIRHSHYDGMQTKRFDRGPIVEKRWHPKVNRSLVEVSPENPRPPAIGWVVAEHRGPPQLPVELLKLVAA